MFLVSAIGQRCKHCLDGRPLRCRLRIPHEQQVRLRCQACDGAVVMHAAMHVAQVARELNQLNLGMHVTESDEDQMRNADAEHASAEWMGKLGPACWWCNKCSASFRDKVAKMSQEGNSKQQHSGTKGLEQRVQHLLPECKAEATSSDSIAAYMDAHSG